MVTVAYGDRVDRAMAPFRGAARLPGKAFYVDSVNGSDSGHNGLSPNRAFATIQNAIDNMSAYDTAFLFPGAWIEDVTIPRTVEKIQIIGLGAFGSCRLTASTNATPAILNHTDDVFIQNVALTGKTTGYAFQNDGSRVELEGCKFTGGSTSNGILLESGTDAEIAADTHGQGADVTIRNSTILATTAGITIAGDGAANPNGNSVDRLRVLNCFFPSSPGLGGYHIKDTATDPDEAFADLLIHGCIFRTAGSGMIIDLDADNGNTGVIYGCQFPVAVDGGKVLHGTGVGSAGNLFTGGVQAATPSA
jgi:hypothetical protein